MQLEVIDLDGQSATAELHDFFSGKKLLFGFPGYNRRNSAQASSKDLRKFKKVLNSPMANAMNNLSFGEFTLDCSSRQLKRGEEVLPVYGKSFDLLVYMANNAGRPLTKGELLSAVWPDTIVEEANLSQNVSQLRKVVGSGTNGPIVTLPGRGYQFAVRVTKTLPEAPVLDIARPTVAPLSAAETTYSLEATHTRIVVEDEIVEQATARRVVTMLAWLGVGVVLLAMAVWFGWQRWLDRTGGPPVSVVLTAMDGTTGDVVLDSALRDALRIDLGQSPFVSMVPGLLVRTTMMQMKHKSDEAVTSELAREICERTNSQAVVHSAIVHTGQHFLLTAEANNCVDGKTIGAAKIEATKADDLPHSIDILAEDLRRNLGESRRSIARFNTPLFPMDTSSLDALKDASKGEQEAARGHISEAIGLFKTAISADPKFASAYYDLAAQYATAGDFSNERIAIEKAYSLLDFAGKPSQFAIIALYNSTTTQDLYASERNYRNWTEIYPRAPQAWNGLSAAQRSLGDLTGSAASCEKALELVPNNIGLYANLADNQLWSGDLNGAQQTLNRAIANGMDGDRIHDTYIGLAEVLGDQAMLQEQRAWIAAHPEAVYSSVQEVEIAIAGGRFEESAQLLKKIVAKLHAQGLDGYAGSLMKGEGVSFIEAGDVEDGTQMLRSSPLDPEDGNELTGLAATGELASAEKYLTALQAKYPQGTLVNSYWGPRIRAETAVAMHRPEEAVTLMEPTRALDGRSLSMRKYRGDIYLAAGKPVMAEKEYRSALAHRELDPPGINFALSWLGLGRALKAEGNRDEAIDAYQHFLGMWANADANATLLQQAKQELRQIAAGRAIHPLARNAARSPDTKPRDDPA